MKFFLFQCSIILFSLSSSIKTCFSEDSPLQDTCPTAPQAQRTIFINGFQCKNPATVTASDFKTSSLNHAGDTDNNYRSSTNLLTASDFPGLNTLGLSIARTDLNVEGLVSPHSHPRASEMFYVARGFIVAAFIDSQNRLFERTLRAGDVFVIPRGLVHFSLNAGSELATTFSVLNSQNPGVVTVADSIFAPESEALGRLMRRVLSISAVYGNVTSGLVSS